MALRARSDSSEVLSVQYLRAVAALLVVFHHARQFPGFKDAVGTGVGSAGVDIFFVISGFVMAVTAGRRNYPALRFLERRSLRIIPLYWSMTLLSAVLSFALPTVFDDIAFTWKHFLSSLLFIPHVSPYPPFNYSPLMKIGWTLNFEMFFYLIFAALMMFGLTLRIGIMTILFAGLILVDSFWHPDFTPLRFWADGQLFEFVMGCAIGQLYASGHFAAVRASFAWAAAAVAIMALVALGSYQFELPRAVLSGVPAAVLVAAGVCLEQHGRVGSSAAWKFLGDASYSIYLVHLLPITVFRRVWTMADLPTDGLANALVFISINMTIATLCASVAYSYFERPVLTFLRQRLRRLQQASGWPPSGGATLSLRLRQTLPISSDPYRQEVAAAATRALREPERRDSTCASARVGRVSRYPG
jgi:exopolysaccharide production protein ExoZ